MRAIKEGNIIILPRNGEVADVFLGIGWENHSIFRLVDGKPKLEKGTGLSETQFRFVRKAMISQ